MLNGSKRLGDQTNIVDNYNINPSPGLSLYHNVSTFLSLKGLSQRWWEEELTVIPSTSSFEAP